MNRFNLRLSLVISATLVSLLLAACGSTADRSEPGQPDPDLTNEVTLADLKFDNGMRVVFSYDEALQGYSLSQRGSVGESVPFVVREYDSLLALFLDITPNEVAVPELLLAEPKLTGQAVSRIENRSLSADVVTAELLETPGTLKTSGVSCGDTYVTGAHWNIPVQHTPAPKTYYSWSYGGKFKYVDSFLINCTPSSYAVSNWARHRIYYKNALGGYVKHFELKVPPWHWDIETRGNPVVNRHRKVIYDHNWNPSCGSCKYGRQGKFR